MTTTPDPSTLVEAQEMPLEPDVSTSSVPTTLEERLEDRPKDDDASQDTPLSVSPASSHPPLETEQDNQDRDHVKVDNQGATPLDDTPLPVSPAPKMTRASTEPELATTAEAY